MLEIISSKYGIVPLNGLSPSIQPLNCHYNTHDARDGKGTGHRNT